MNLSKEQVLNIALKVLTDVDFGTDDLEEPTAQFFAEGDFLMLGEGVPAWQVSFIYDAESFGYDPPAMVFVEIGDSDGIARRMIYRIGMDLLGYDAAADKYFKKPRPQPK